MRLLENLRLNDIPVGRKLVFLYVFGILIPLLVGNWFFLSNILTAAREQELEYLTSTVKAIQTDVEREIDQAVRLSNAIYSERTFYELLEREYVDIRDYLDAHYRFLSPSLTKYLLVYPALESVTIYSTNKVVETSAGFLRLNPEVVTSYWYNSMKSSPDSTLLLFHSEFDQRKTIEKRDYLSLIGKMDNPSYSYFVNKELVLRIDIDLTAIQEYLQKPLVHGEVALIDQGGNLVVRQGIDTFGGSELYAFNIPFAGIPVLKGWSLSATIGFAGTSQVRRTALLQILLVGGLSVALASALILVVSHSINYRLRHLSRHMLRVENQEFSHIDIQAGKDEIGILIRDFNFMIDRINSLINDVYLADIAQNRLLLEQKQAQLHALQSQVQPHFLYNTLESIRMKAVIKNERETAEVIKKLSKAFRRIVSWGDDLITVQEEVTFATEYLEIMKYRFGNRLTYTIDIDEAVVGCYIPRMVIQTLVENACVHGIGTMDGVGVVEVEVGEEPAALSISIRDNGHGIDPDAIESILSETDVSTNGRSVGLINVLSRLRILYSDDYTFRIHSAAGSETSIDLTVPKKWTLKA